MFSKISNKSIMPLRDRVLVLVHTQRESSVSQGGIVLTEETSSKVLIGEILRVGKGEYNSNTDQLIPMNLKEGDKVIFNPYTAIEIETSQNSRMFLAREDDILALID